MKTVSYLLDGNITSDDFSFKNSLLVGDNSSAKTYILEGYLNKKRKSENCYYISVENRNLTLDISIINEVHLHERNTISTLLDKRLEGTDDLWVDNSLGKNIFSMIFISGDYNDVISDFFGFNVEVKKVNSSIFNKYVACFNGVENLKISNGISSIIRLLIEIEIGVKLNCTAFFIDEIEKYLDSNNAYKLIKFIQNRYVKQQFIITTHSDDIIVGSKDFNVIKINNDNDNVNNKTVEIYNSNDYNSSGIVKRKFFQVHEELEFIDSFNYVNDIYTDIIVNSYYDNKNDDTLYDLLSNDSTPQQIKNVILEINDLKEI